MELELEQDCDRHRELVDIAAVWGLKLPDAVRKSKCYGGQPSDTTDERMVSAARTPFLSSFAFLFSPKKKPQPKRFGIKMKLGMGMEIGRGRGRRFREGAVTAV